MNKVAHSSRWVKVLFGVDRPREILQLAPGVTLAVAVMLAALPLSDGLGRGLLRWQGINPVGKAGPISGVPVAILLGLLIRNLFDLPAPFHKGIPFCTTKLLRLGIILVGIKLSLFDIFKLGVAGIPVVVAAVVAGLLFVIWFNRLLRLPARLGTLIAAGTSICGVTAIVSTAPAIDASEREVAYAVANITIFGLMGMLLYPYLAPRLLHTSAQIGLFLGTAVHDTSQVVGAAMTYKEVFLDDNVLQAATVTKLTRNLLLAIVVPLLAFCYMRQTSGDGPRKAAPVDIKKLLPFFVLGFVGMALIRTLGDATLKDGLAFGLWDPKAWKSLTTQVGDVWASRYLLGTAMAAVGLGTSFSVFKGIGLKPFAVGLAGALLVGAVGLIMALLLGPYVHM